MGQPQKCVHIVIKETAMKVNIDVGAGVLTVQSPYSKQFADFAHMRNAIWSDSKKAWAFDPRDEFAVRSTMIDIYGTDDYNSCNKVDVRVALDNIDTDCKRIWICGREVVYRKYYDRHVNLGEGVAIISGGFADRGNFRSEGCNAEKETVLEIRDVPCRAAEKSLLEYPNNIKIISGINREVLLNERQKCAERIIEIDKLLEIKEADLLDDLSDNDDGAPTNGS
jgi:hypothetical protein